MESLSHPTFHLPLSTPVTGSSSAFTLTELLVAMMLVLLLMVGVGSVFRWTGDAVSAGQILSSAQRSYRAALGTMVQDLRNVVPDGPVFVIQSTRITRPVNISDSINGSSYRHSFDYDSYRVHRADLLRFFARGRYQRTGGDDGSFTSQTIGGEAHITYGHLGLWAFRERLEYPNFNGTQTAHSTVLWDIPELGTNYTASEWLLGRSVLLMKDGATLRAAGETHLRRETSPPMIPPHPGTYNPVHETWDEVIWPWWYRDPFTADAPWEVSFNLSPLAFGSSSSDGGRAYTVEDSRYDVAETTLAEFRQVIAEAVQRQARYPLPPPGNYTQQVRIVRWWHPLVFTGLRYLGGEIPSGADPKISFGGHPRFPRDRNNAYFVVDRPPTYDIGWVYAYSGDGSPPAQTPFRFGADPDVVSPLTSIKAAQAAPCFLQYCSQFAAEYAGDFLSQDAAGDVTATRPDGQIDFIIRTVGGQPARQVRWYGMPRDADGDGRIYGFVAGRRASQMPDVLPLRDLARTAAGASPPADPESPGDNCWYGMAHEKDVEGLFGPPRDDYSVQYASNDSRRAREEAGQYICIWRDDVPTLVRLWVQTDDPTGRVLAGQRQEIVVRLK